MINFYQRFIPYCSTILHPLTNLVQRKKKSITLGGALHAFQKGKASLVDFTKLAFIERLVYLLQQMHLTLELAQRLNRNLIHNTNPLCFSQPNFYRLRLDIALFVMNYWQSTWLLNTFDTYWKLEFLQSLLTINL